MLSSAFDKVKFFAKKFPKDSDLDDSGVFSSGILFLLELS